MTAHLLWGQYGHDIWILCDLAHVDVDYLGVGVGTSNKACVYRPTWIYRIEIPVASCQKPSIFYSPNRASNELRSLGGHSCRLGRPWATGCAPAPSPTPSPPPLPRPTH